MKTILITGSAGYIGNNLCDLLIKLGYNIIQIDKKYGSNILDVDFNEYHPNFIVHLAAIPGIQDCQNNIENAINDNVLTTNIISNYAKKENIPIIFASSQAVKDPTSSVYAMTKLICERILKQHNNYIILRLSNVYAGLNYLKMKSSVIAQFINNYQNNKPLLINGNGTQTRDFIHCEDVCKVIETCIKNDISKMIFDVGTGIETSIIEVAQMFEYDYQLTDNHKTGIKSSVADTKTIEYLNIKPESRIKDYISRTLSI